MDEKFSEKTSDAVQDEKKRTDVPNKNVSRETILAGSDYKALYKLFRDDGMSRSESLYNAAYIGSHNKYYNSEISPQAKYEFLYNHPHEWSSDKKKLYKKNVWSLITSALDKYVKIHLALKSFGSCVVSGFKKMLQVPGSLDNSVRATNTLKRLFLKIAMPIMSVVLLVYTVTTISASTGKIYGVGVYIDGKYAGNTLHAEEIISGKHKYEDSLTSKYGISVVLDCNVEFKPQLFSQEDQIAPGDTSIYNEYMKTFTQDGYGLYIDNELAAVSEVEKWLSDAVNEYLEKYVGKNKGETVVYNNNITIIADRYPQSYFLGQEQIRQMFMLDASSKTSSSLNLDYSNVVDVEAGVVGLTPPVTVDVAVEKQEFSRVTVPYTVVELPDDTVLRGMRKLVSDGKDGEKVIRYKSKYLNNKLVSQEVISEDVIYEPVAKVVCVGTKEPTADEVDLLPTGTYILPNDGFLTSKYGWRKLRGQNNFHQAIDIASTKGSPIVASDGGEVVEVGYTKGYGKYCVIRHNEEISTRYAHCDTIDVEVGDLVGQGYIIATMGATGNVTGVHVHFEIIKDGTTVDPLPYIANAENIKWSLLG